MQVTLFQREAHLRSERILISPIFREYIECYFNKDKLKLTIMWLRDTGVLEKIKYDVMKAPFPIPDPQVMYNQPLILRQLGIIMIVLVVGLFISTLVFFVELVKKQESYHSEARDILEMTKINSR